MFMGVSPGQIRRICETTLTELRDGVEEKGLATQGASDFVQLVKAVRCSQSRLPKERVTWREKQTNPML
jgi:hypothetical protein